MIGTPRRIVAPTEPALTRAQVRDHLSIIGDDHDRRIDQLISVATEYAEKETRRALITQTWEENYYWFPPAIALAKSPVQSITHIKYYNDQNVLTTLNSSLYDADIVSLPSVIRPAYGQSWPSTYERANAVIVTYVAGYASESLIPGGIKHAMLMLIAHWFENREAHFIGQGFTTSSLPDAAVTLLAQNRVYGR